MRISDRSSDVCSSDLHDAGQPVEVADDVGEGTDVEHLALQLGDHVLALAGGVAHGPIKAGDGHVDDDQRGGKERPFTRSEERRVGKEGVRTGRSRWWQYH